MTSLVILAIASHTIAQKPTLPSATITPRLLRQPDIHGNTIVFLYAGDLWAANAEQKAIAKRIAVNVGIRGGNAAHMPITRPHISPDGKMVAFTASYDGAPNVYVVNIDGGEPKRLTLNNNSEQVIGWTPDGKVMYLTTEGQPYANRQAQLKIISINGGIPEDTPIKEISAGSFFANGKKIAYNRFNSFYFNWRRYRGGSQGKISIYDFEKNEYSELPAKRDQNYFPMVAGDSIYYVSDRSNGTLNLFRHSNGKDTQLTKFEDADIRFPGTDGKRFIWERNGYLNLFDPANNQEVKLEIQIPSDNLNSRPALKNLVPYLNGLAISPSGNRVAIDARGEVFSVPTKSGETRNMTNTSGVREQSVDWSPDGKWITYISDKTGEREIYAQPQLGGEEVALTSASPYRIESYSWTPNAKHIMFVTSEPKAYLLEIETKKVTELEDLKTGAAGFSFSVDGRYVAYTLGKENGWKSIYVQELATRKKNKVTEGYFDDNSVTFDRNGNWLYFSSSRTFAPSFGTFEFSLKVDSTERLYAIPLRQDVPNPFLDSNDEEKSADEPPQEPKSNDRTIDFNNIENRTIVLPAPPGQYGQLEGFNGGFFYVSQGTLFQYAMGAKQPTPIYQGIGPYVFNASQTKLAVLLPQGVQVVPVAPGQNPSVGRVDLSNVEAVIDPKAEWKQMFWDAWRYQRDHFYDPGMVGLNWKAIGDQYAELLPSVNHRADLGYIFGMLIGELGTGHAYVQGPGEMPATALPRVPVGTLAADYEVKNGAVAFKKIVRGFNHLEQTQTPLGLSGINVKEGEYLLAIDGKTVTPQNHPNEFLLGKVGKLVTLTVNDQPTLAGSRKVRVKPIATDTRARYEEFIEGNRKMVEKLSGGRIGYMHIQNTAAEGSSDFVRGFYSQSDKDAMIVDERWNGGGYIQPWFVDTLARKKKSMIQPRVGIDSPDSPSIEGPMAMLINGYAGSGGDFFPYMFRQAKRGPLIGKRTWGGLVGISGGFNLVDGGNLTSPNFALYNPETNEIIAENTGVDPDMDIDMRPDLVAQGRDPQLEAAVKHLMDELAKMPAKKVRKDIPKINKNGRIGG